MNFKTFVFNELNKDQKEASLKKYRALDNDFFPIPWSETSWKGLISNQNNYFLVHLEIEKELVGFSLYLLSQHEKIAHLLKVVINPMHRKQGHANRLLETASSHLIKIGLESIYLEVETSNNGAIKHYESSGLCVIHTKPNFYGAGRDAFIMTGPIKVE